MRVLSKYLRGTLSLCVGGACAAAASGDSNIPEAIVLLLAAVLLAAPSLPGSGQAIDAADTNS